MSLTSCVVLCGTAHAQTFNASTSYQVVDLNPPGHIFSFGFGSGGGQFGGEMEATASGSMEHAAVWTGAAPDAVVDLNDTGSIRFDRSRVTGVDRLNGNLRVGTGAGPTTVEGGFGVRDHAVVWNGTTATDINPTSLGFISSGANAVSGNLVAGVAGSFNAFLWHLDGGAPANLNTSAVGFLGVHAISIADGVSTDFTVGNGSGSATDNQRHAIAWNNSTLVARDLNPAGYLYSYSTAVFGNLAVGYGSMGQTGNHAFLWNLLTGTTTDLHPASGFADTEAFAIGGNEIAGIASPTTVGGGAGIAHGYLWSATTGATIDLQQFIDPGIYSTFTPQSIDPNGTIFGYAATLLPNGKLSNSHALALVPTGSGVPEASPALLLLIGGFLFGGYAWARRTRNAALKRV